jgi:hypothetical protein
VFRSPDALLPSYTLPPFGSMGSSTDGLFIRTNTCHAMVDECRYGPNARSRHSNRSFIGSTSFSQSLSVSAGMGCSLNQSAPTITTATGASYQSPFENPLSCSPPPNQRDSNTSCSPQTWSNDPTSG